jgi:hypothetical protein
MMKIPKIILLVLLLAQIAFADCSFGWNVYVPTGQCVPDYLINMATITIAITFLIIGIAYALSQVLANAKLAHWSETEMYELLGTAMILAVYLSGSVILNTLIGPAFYNSSLAYPGEPRSGGSWTTVEDHVNTYLSDELRFIKEDVIRNMMWMASITGVLSTASLMFTSGSSMLSIPIAPAFGGTHQAIFSFIGIVAASAVQLKLQLEIVGLWKGMFNILLPLGIALRAFPYTRTAGGAAIAIAVGFTIVLPIAYLIVEDVSGHYKSAHCSGGVNVLGDPMNSILSGFGGTGSIDKAIKDFMNSDSMNCLIFRIGIEATVLPFFAYLMTLNIIRRLAEMMGAHIDFGALVRMI